MKLPSVTLTPQERKILHLIALGLNSREIGTKLGIAWQTVGTHRKALKGKLRSPGRNGITLVRAAIRQGLLKKEAMQ